MDDDPYVYVGRAAYRDLARARQVAQIELDYAIENADEESAKNSIRTL